MSRPSEDPRARDLEDAPAEATVPGIPSDASATVQPPALAFEPDILAAFAAAAEAAGLRGESRAVKLTYLVVTSRLLERPVSLALKGPSAAGKSYLLETVLGFFPSSAYYALSAMSERALAYDREPLQHRMLVLYEAAGLGSELATYLMRSLLSEGRVRYTTVEKTRSGLQPRTIEREGPTGLITTTTAVKLHPENETRLLSLTIADSPEQTKAVLLAQARPALDVGPLREPWQDLQTYLDGANHATVVPYAEQLAEQIPPVAVRLRRDFPALLAREEEGVPAEVAVEYLRELPVTWAKATGGTGRQLVADALFERIEVLGLQEATAHLSEHAVRHGFAEALPEEFGISVSGRGERSRDDDNHVIATEAAAMAAIGLNLARHRLAIA